MFLNSSHRDLSIGMKKNIDGAIFYQKFSQKLLGVCPEFSKKSQEFQKSEIFQNQYFQNPEFPKIHYFQNLEFPKLSIFKILNFQNLVLILPKFGIFKIWNFRMRSLPDNNFMGRLKHNLGPAT